MDGMQEFFRAVSHQVLNEIQEARMLVTAFPYLVDVPAVCDLLASEPASVTSDSEEAEEPFRSHTLPGNFLLLTWRMCVVLHCTVLLVRRWHIMVRPHLGV